MYVLGPTKFSAKISFGQFVLSNGEISSNQGDDVMITLFCDLCLFRRLEFFSKTNVIQFLQN
jgi:hypothetical protein